MASQLAWLKHRLRQASETITSKAGDWILGFPALRVKPAGENTRASCRLAKTCQGENHDKLMGRVAKRVEDTRLLKLIRDNLTAGVVILSGDRHLAELAALPANHPDGVDGLQLAPARRGRPARYRNPNPIRVGENRAARRPTPNRAHRHRASHRSLAAPHAVRACPSRSNHRPSRALVETVPSLCRRSWRLASPATCRRHSNTSARPVSTTHWPCSSATGARPD